MSETVSDMINFVQDNLANSGNVTYGRNPDDGVFVTFDDSERDAMVQDLIDCVKEAKHIENLLLELEDYFDSMADADFVDGVFVANQEMNFQTQVRIALGKETDPTKGMAA